MKYWQNQLVNCKMNIWYHKPNSVTIVKDLDVDTTTVGELGVSYLEK